MLAGTIARGQSIPLIDIPLYVAETNVYTWTNAVWWTNSVVPTNIQTWQAWWAVRSNFGIINYELDQVADSFSGLADAHTNSMLNSFRTAAIVSNSVVMAAGETNILGTVTNLAGVDFTIPGYWQTNAGWEGSNGPILLLSFDGGTNWNPGSGSLVTNVPVMVAFFSGTVPSNPPVQQIPMPGSVTNVTVYQLVRPDLFGITNAAYGQHFEATDPIYPQEVATKNYVDGVFLKTDWWDAKQDVQFNGYNLNLSSTWQLATDSLTNSTSYRLRLLGQDLITATASQPVSIAAVSVTVTNSTNILVKVPTNGVIGSLRLQLSHYIKPTAWIWLTNVPSVVTTNYQWTIPKPYSDTGFLMAMAPSTNEAVITLGGFLRLRSVTITNSSDSTYGYTDGLIRWDSNYIYVSVASNLWKRAALSTW